MTDQDLFVVEIARGIELNQRGESNLARQIFNDLWERLSARGDPYHRCAVAHSMADTCHDLNEELTWDLLALEAARLITQERAHQASIGDLTRIFPSLHLNPTPRRTSPAPTQPHSQRWAGRAENYVSSLTDIPV